jgi:YVTN family beta-propeller protein
MTTRHVAAILLVTATTHCGFMPNQPGGNIMKTGLITWLGASRRAFLGCLVLAAAVPAHAQVTVYAFVPNSSDNTVTVIDPASLAAFAPPIPVGATPVAAAVTPDARLALVVNAVSNTVTTIDVATRTTIGAAIPVGITPVAVAVTRDARRAYVANAASNTVTVIDLTTNTAGISIPVGTEPAGLALTPDNTRLYVVNRGSNNVSVINTATNTPGTPIAAGTAPGGITIAPDGARAYVANTGSDNVSVIALATNTTDTPLPAGIAPGAVAMSPDGRWLYVANAGGNDVTVIDTVTHVTAATIPVGSGPSGVGFTPDGRDALVTNRLSNNVSVIDTATHTVSGSIAAGAGPIATNTFISPRIIVSGPTPLTVTSQAEIDALGASGFLNINGGTLRVAVPRPDWISSFPSVTLPKVSLLARGGTIHTVSTEIKVTEAIVGDSVLTLMGQGIVALTGSRDTGHTISSVNLIVNGSHLADLTSTAGGVTGRGQLGTVHVTGGFLECGSYDGPGTALAILSATHVTLAPGVNFAVDVLGLQPGVSHDRLAVTGTFALNGATLIVGSGDLPAPNGTQIVIATNVTGTFAGLPEGAFVPNTRRLRITYAGGDGNDVALLPEAAPTLTNPGPQTVLENRVLGPIAFNVSDDIVDASNLIVSGRTEAYWLIPDANIVVAGSGATRTVTMTPVPGASGTATIVLAVSDGAFSTTQHFQVTITPLPRYGFAEGATGAFFETDFLLLNPNTEPVDAHIDFMKNDGANIAQDRTLPPRSRLRIRAKDVAGLEAAAFSTFITSRSGLPIVAERTMRWGAAGYGAHTERATEGVQAGVQFAEGASGPFSTYFLLVNPSDEPGYAFIEYIRQGSAAQPPLRREVPMPPRSRITVDATREPELRDLLYGAIIYLSPRGFGERSMYFGENPLWTGGSVAAGLESPSTTWYFAEGATGSYFNTYLLLMNPTTADAEDVTVTYLPETGIPVTRHYSLPDRERLTLDVAAEDPSLANAAVAMRIESTISIVAERAQYWPHPAWHESHVSQGVTAPGVRWALAEGQVGGPDNHQTYVLLANFGTTAADVAITLIRENGTPIVKHVTVAPMSRVNFTVTGPDSDVPELQNEGFGAVIESTQPIVVERSMYADAGGIIWASGTSAPATRLP